MFATFGVLSKMDFDDEVSGAFAFEGLVAGEVVTMSDAIGAGAADGISDLISFWSFFDIITDSKLCAYENTQ